MPPWNLAAGAPNEISSYDFLVTRTRDGGSVRVLNVVDEYTRRPRLPRRPLDRGS